VPRARDNPAVSRSYRDDSVANTGLAANRNAQKYRTWGEISVANTGLAANRSKENAATLTRTLSQRARDESPEGED
jgi:hypothetical protein